jgi:hypothetical protein
MNGAAISLGLFLTLALVAYIAWPWWAQRGGWKPVKPAQKMQREALLERREAILITLRDLEFDYSVAKVTKDDYESLRRPGAFYCVKCGSELPALCPECGQATEPADAFCRACGTELASSFQQQLAQQ